MKNGAHLIWTVVTLGWHGATDLSSSGRCPRRWTEESRWAVWSGPGAARCRRQTEPAWGDDNTELTLNLVGDFRHLKSHVSVIRPNTDLGFVRSLCCTVYCVWTSRTSLPRHEDQPRWCSFSDRIGTLHRQLHGDRVEGGAKEAE